MIMINVNVGDTVEIIPVSNSHRWALAKVTRVTSNGEVFVQYERATQESKLGFTHVSGTLYVSPNLRDANGTIEIIAV
jgi:hypothetical protein